MTAEAMPKVHVKDIAKACEAWWREHGSRYDDPEWRAYLKRYGELIVEKHKELSTEHTNVGPDGVRRFGMAGAGSCLRKATLKYLEAEREPLSGSTHATFHIGHLLEIMGICTLERIGCTIRGMQEPVTLGPMSSYSDGIITVGGLDYVLSVKTQGYKSSSFQKGTYRRMGFPATVNGGVRQENAGWWVQLQAEMCGHVIHRGLVLVIAKDMILAMKDDPAMVKNGSLTFYAEEIAYDAEFATKLLVPAWEGAFKSALDGEPYIPLIFTADGTFKELPKPGDIANGWSGPNKEVTGTYSPCFGCEVREACVKGLKP